MNHHEHPWTIWTCQSLFFFKHVVAGYGACAFLPLYVGSFVWDTTVGTWSQPSQAWFALRRSKNSFPDAWRTESYIPAGTSKWWQPSLFRQGFNMVSKCVPQSLCILHIIVHILYVLCEVFCCMAVSLLSLTIPELRIWCSWALGIRMEISSMARNGRRSAAGCQSTLPFRGTMRTRRPGNTCRRSPPCNPWHFSFGQVLQQTVQEKIGWRHRKHAANGSSLVVLYFSIAVGRSILLHARRLVQWRYLQVYVQDLIEEQGRHVCKLLDAWLKRQPNGESCQPWVCVCVPHKGGNMWEPCQNMPKQWQDREHIWKYSRSVEHMSLLVSFCTFRIFECEWGLACPGDTNYIVTTQY